MDSGIVYARKKYRETEGITDLFNKSHSYSYSVLCLQTAYLKAHYPVYFFTALFNMNKNKPGMVNKHMLDAKDFEVEILPPDINKSQVNFSVSDNKILFGLSAITQIGDNVAEQIINERNLHGKYTNIENCMQRVGLSKSQIISLIKSGAIPSKNKKKTLIKFLKSQFEIKEYEPVKTLPTKKVLLLQWDIDAEDFRDGKKINKDALLMVYNRKKKELFDTQQVEKFNKYKEECELKYLQNEKFWEFEALQIFVSDENPFKKAYQFLNDYTSCSQGDKCVIVGIISKIQKKKTKKGQQFAFANIYSGDGLIEITIWPDALQKFQNLIVKGQQVAVLGKKENDTQMIADKIKPYDVWLKDVSI